MGVWAKVMLGGLIATLFLMVVVAVSFFQIRAVIDNFTVAVADQSLIKDAMNIKVGVEKEVVGLQAFLLAGEDWFLDPLHEGKADIARTAAEMRRHLKTDDDRKALDEIEQLNEAFLAGAEQAIALKQAGRHGEALNLMTKQVKDSEYLLTTRTDSLIERQTHLVSASEAQAVTQATRSTIMTIGIAIPAILLAFLIAWLVARAFSVQVVAAAEMAQRLAAGDLTVKPLPALV